MSRLVVQRLRHLVPRSDLRSPWKIAVMVLLTCVYAGCTIQTASHAPEPPFPMLDPYGQWFVRQPFGEVWQPRVPRDWRPFYDGRWLWTDRGWYWDSPEPYGWVVYHYGSWVFDEGNGWVWVPGYDWSPARVQWFVSDRYIGWAPLLPGQAAIPDPGILWTVVPTRTFAFDHVAQYHVRSVPSLQSRGNTTAHRPPDIRMIEQQSARPVPQHRTETQKVRSGGRSLTQVRITEEQSRGGAGEVPSPPPGGDKNPPPTRTRESGQTRTAPSREPPHETPAAPPDTTRPTPTRQREERKPG